MKEQKYYRSPIDELVSKSGMSAKAIAQEMGIKYHRMVALRRLKDVQDDDMQNCGRAIAALKDNPAAYRKPGKPKSQVIKNPHVGTSSKPKSYRVETPTPEPKVRMLARSQRERTSNFAFMLGQALGLLDNIFDTLETNHVEIPALLERKKQLEEQCNKLLDI